MTEPSNQTAENSESMASPAIDSELENRLANANSSIDAGEIMALEINSESIDPEMAIQCLSSDPSMAQLIMRNEFEGRTYLTVHQKLHFSPQQQTQVVHIPFSPPLTESPKIEATLEDEVNARLRITDCQKFGIRLEVVLPIEDDQPVNKTLIVNVA